MPHERSQRSHRGSGWLLFRSGWDSRTHDQVSGQLGVCSVHQGPGLTNTMTGLTEAAKSRTPLLVLAADTTVPTVVAEWLEEAFAATRSLC